MKNVVLKRFILFLLMSVGIVVTGCAPITEAPRNVSAGSPTPKTSTIESDTLESICQYIESAVDLYDCNVYVEEKDGGVDVKMSMRGGMTDWIFADCVIAVTEAARESISESGEALNNIEVAFIIETPGADNQVITWNSTDFDTGLLIDSRTKYAGKGITISELAEKYGYDITN